MTLGTIGNGMPLGQWEKIVIYLVCGPIRPGNIVAIHAIRRKAGAFMVRVLGRGIIRQMATDASIADTVEAEPRLGFMAVGTICRCMDAHQRKTVFLV